MKKYIYKDSIEVVGRLVEKTEKYYHIQTADHLLSWEIEFVREEAAGVLDQVIGVDEASELWGLSPGYIKNLCAEGKVEARKIGKTWIILKNQNNPKMKK